MIKYLILIFLFLALPAHAGLIDSCDFTETSTTDLATSDSNKCQTPSGSTAWTETQDTVTGGGNYNADAGDFAESGADEADGVLLYEAPTDPTINKVMVQANFQENSTVGTTDTQCIWAGSDSSNYYSVCSVDDNGTAYRVYKRVANVSTSLGSTTDTFANNSNETVILEIIPSGGVRVYVAGVLDKVFVDSSLTSFTKCGIGCGALQVTNDDCDTTGLHLDNFQCYEMGERSRTIN